MCLRFGVRSYSLFIYYCWDAMKRFRLKLMSDIEEYLSIESMIKRGSSMISKGYAKANNKF